MKPQLKIILNGQNYFKWAKLLLILSCISSKKYSNLF